GGETTEQPQTSTGMDATGTGTTAEPGETTAVDPDTTAGETTAGLMCDEPLPPVGEIDPACIAYEEQFNECFYDGMLPQECLDLYEAYCQESLEESSWSTARCAVWRSWTTTLASRSSPARSCAWPRISAPPRSWRSTWPATESRCDMKIGIIGAGMIGGTLAELWTRAGHQVMVSSRHPEALTPPAGVEATTLERAATEGEVVLLAVPFGAPAAFDQGVKAQLRGKVVLDANNPIVGRDGAVAREVIEGGRGSAVWTAEQLPGARVVKAFNTVYFKTMLAQAGQAEPVAVPLASDDED